MVPYLVGVGLMVACGVEGQGKHSCATEPVLELEGGCVFSLSCVGALSRTGFCKNVKALHLFPESLACEASGPCEITGLASDIFSGMDRLESLYLSHHAIDELPGGDSAPQTHASAWTRARDPASDGCRAQISSEMPRRCRRWTCVATAW